MWYVKAQIKMWDAAMKKRQKSKCEGQLTLLVNDTRQEHTLGTPNMQRYTQALQPHLLKMRGK